MKPESIKIIIVGGGTAGWMTAAALATQAASQNCEVVLVESDQIASVGVGEATLPAMKEFNDYIGLNEADVMRKTQATFKLGIEFSEWLGDGSSYIHPFGTFGKPIAGIDFHQHWTRLYRQQQAQSLDAYSFAVMAARHGRFDFPVLDHKEINSTFSYAYHFDAGLYASYLRRFAEDRGVKRVEGRITQVAQQETTGAITSIVLESGEDLIGDYFIDCSGFRSLLLKETLHAEFEDWSPWLLCDRALAVASDTLPDLPAYTRALAQSAGWQWRIPLQQRTGNGYVFCSEFISEDEASSSLISNLNSEPASTPKLIKFKAGRYRNSWTKNCIAIGLSSGFLEPLESTSIYLIQVAIFQLLRLFPGKNPDVVLIEEFNRVVDVEYSRIRDFLILHYHLNKRNQGELWRYCREMSIPESLRVRLQIFLHRGYLDSYKFGLFNQASWLAVLVGQGEIPKGGDPFVERISLEQAAQILRAQASEIESRVAIMPSHAQFLRDYCPVSS